ncbi:hypothetical protein [Falsiroseomonas oryzae]|uniref:hypothetical protein n=1 Tax=Falsiroseomonas oryzae TaxID=2766473 RepID=UPI0022EAB741|nr:hypothetical protein [Roseomonas sp. MO-31]
MRRPALKAVLWFALAGLGALALLPMEALQARFGDWVLLAGVPAVAAIPFGLVFGLMAALSAFGEARLRRGGGVIARWSLDPAAWDDFRSFDAMRTAQHPSLQNDFTPQPAAGRAVEVLFGRKQVIVDGSYHPLRRWAVPELRSVGWLQPQGAPECLEFGLAYPRGRYGGVILMSLRIPVPLAARRDGVRVFEHFLARAPKHRVGLAYRRPWLVIGWGVALTVLSLLASAGGVVLAEVWRPREAGEEESVVPMLLQLGGIIAAIGAAVFTVIIVLATRPWRRREQA